MKTDEEILRAFAKKHKNCFNCKHLINVGIDVDFWQCEKEIFNILDRGTDFLCCPLFESCVVDIKQQG